MMRQATLEAIQQAAALLRAGELVAFPTETVFGLGGNALDTEAVQRIFDVKQRPAANPLSIMVPDLAAAERYAVFDDRALTLAHTLWPGPISLVLPLRTGHGISPLVTAGKDTISLRCPRHATAMALLRETGFPLAAPSANPSGSLSTTTALDVAKDLAGKVPLILADASRVIGLESTLLDLTQHPAVILRLGAVSQEEIAAQIGDVILAVSGGPAKLRLKTPLRLSAVDVKQGEAFLGFGSLNYIGVHQFGFVRDMPQPLWRNLSVNGDLHEAAANFYGMLHELDEAGAAAIAVMKLPDEGLGRVMNKRLEQAA